MALNINGSTGISGVDGSNSAPALSGTDSNTGINFGSDVIDLNCGGSSRVKIASAGQIGIGGANYGALRDVLVSNGSSSAISWGANPHVIDTTGMAYDRGKLFLHYREVSVSGNGLVHIGMCRSTTNCPSGRIGIPVGFVCGTEYNAHFRVDKVGVTPWPDNSNRYTQYVVISDFVVAGTLGIYYLTDTTS